jgi:uncharacterized membrane protein YgcG
MKAIIGAIAIAGALFVPAQEAAAEDARWAPWLGCWQRVSEDVREGVEPFIRADESDGVETAPRVCVTQSGENQVTLTTTVPEQPPAEQMVIADGKPHPVAASECRGTEQAEWSTSGLRLFERASVICEDGLPRSISGMSLITADDVWIDIRSFMVAGRVTTRVSRYRRDGAPASDDVDRATLTMAEIKEAAAKVSETVLEAAVMEAGANVTVNKRTLIELADAGVPPKVLDVMVALAYPERFVVDRARQEYAGGGARTEATLDVSGGVYFYPAFYYAPFSYSYFDPEPRGPVGIWGGPIHPGSINPIRDAGAARAVNHQGYTRIRPNDPPSTAVPRTQSGSSSNSGGGSGFTRSPSFSGGASSPSSGDSSGGGSSASPSSSGSSGGSSASPSGFSRGDSGTDTGRTAQPR